MHRTMFCTRACFTCRGTWASPPLPRRCEVPLVLQSLSVAGLPCHGLLTPWHPCAVGGPVPVSSPSSRAGAGLSNTFIKAAGFSEIVALLTHRVSVSVDKSPPIVSPNFCSLRNAARVHTVSLCRGWLFNALSNCHL